MAHSVLSTKMVEWVEKKRVERRQKGGSGCLSTFATIILTVFLDLIKQGKGAVLGLALLGEH